MSDEDKILGKMAEDARKAFGHPLPVYPPEIREVFWPGSSMSAWQEHSRAVLELLKKKDAAYGDAWVQQGYMGNLARIFSKASRVKNLMWSDQSDHTSWTEEGQESVLDTLYDLSALCAFAIVNIEEGNRWGR